MSTSTEAVEVAQSSQGSREVAEASTTSMEVVEPNSTSTELMEASVEVVEAPPSHHRRSGSFHKVPWKSWMLLQDFMEVVEIVER